MSTVTEMYPQRENVYILSNNELTPVLYQSLDEKDIYCVELLSGSYAVYRKTHLFDDDPLEKVKTYEQAIELLTQLKTK